MMRNNYMFTKSNLLAVISAFALLCGTFDLSHLAAQEASGEFPRSTNTVTKAPSDEVAAKEDVVQRFRHMYKALLDKKQLLEQQLIEAKKDFENNPATESRIKELSAQLTEIARTLENVKSNISLENQQLADMKLQASPPTLDQLLARAMENHPDVAAAKAKLNMAAAELKSKQLEVAREVIGLTEGQKEQEALVARAEAKLATIMNAIKGAPNSVSRQEVDEAKSELTVAKVKLDRIRSDYQHLINAERNSESSVTDSDVKLYSMAPQRVPQGPAVDKLRTALDEPADFEFAETSLKDCLDFMAIKYKFPIQLLPDMSDVATTMPITSVTKDCLLRDFLELLEDGHDEIAFVVRDYGLVLTKRDNARKHGYISAIEFGRAPAAGKPVLFEFNAQVPSDFMPTLSDPNSSGANPKPVVNSSKSDHDSAPAKGKADAKPTPASVRQTAPPSDNPFGPSTPGKEAPPPTFKSTDPFGK